MRDIKHKTMRFMALMMTVMLITGLASLTALAQDNPESGQKKKLIVQPPFEAQAATSQMLPPANDNFTAAQFVSGPLVNVNGSNAEASKETGEPNHADIAGGKSVWYAWTATSTGAVTVTTLGSSFDTLLAVYTGDNVNALVLIAANDDGAPGNTSKVVLGVISGATYRIAVDGYAAQAGNIALNLTFTFSPLDDNFANAEQLSGETAVGITGTNVGSTKEAGEPAPLVAGNKTVWYRWTAPSTRSYTFYTQGHFDDGNPPQILVYTGASVNNLTFIRGNFSYGNNRLASVSLPAVANTTYRIQINGLDGPGGNVSMGNFTLNLIPTKSRLTYDGTDGVTDFTIYRPSDGGWYTLENSSGGLVYTFNWGASTDMPVPADYNGDGIADRAVFRPSNGGWYIRNSIDGTSRGVAFGNSTDRPVPGDYDGDGKADIAVFRQSAGAWYILRSIDGTLASHAFGQIGDVPVPGYYDADNKLDIAVFRPSDGMWYLLRSQMGLTSVQWGTGTDKPVAADYNGDGITDIAVFRPSDGYWHIYSLVGGDINSYQWGAPFADIPVVGDYDGDGKSDLAVYRQSSHTFYVRQSSNGALLSTQWGTGDDLPATSAYVPE